MVQIKVCGLTTIEAVVAAIKGRASYVGCSFDKYSPCNLMPSMAAEITSDLPAFIDKVAVVGVLENTMLEEVINIFKPHYIQFDADTSPDEISYIRKRYNVKTIKNIRVGEKGDIEEGVRKFNDAVDMFLFDAHTKNQNFVELPDSTFDWGLVKNCQIEKPWILSGGLNRFNVQNAIRASDAKIINASTALEEVLGIKSPKLIEDFINVSQRRYF